MSDPLPAAGSVYSFRTAPFTQFAPQTTGRYAALKVLGCNEHVIVIAVLNAIWERPPSLDEVRSCDLLRQHRFFGTGKVAVFGMNTEWWALSDLAEMTLLGTMPITAEESQFVSNTFDGLPGSTFSILKAASIDAEGEWRWANDREALIE